MKSKIISLVLALSFLPAATKPMGSTIITDGFVSQYVPRSPSAPAGDPRRLFNVIVPATFFSDPSSTFPIIYHLTGFGGDYTTYSQSDKMVLDGLLAANQVTPMIIVAPDPSVLLYEDNFYVNSSLTGLFEDYIVRELIPYVDAKYRQKISTSGEARFYRAIMGQSMGGFGSLFYGIKHPELFIAYASDSGTSFWCINTDLAVPNTTTTFPCPGGAEQSVAPNNMYTFYKLLKCGLDQNDGVLNPQNDDITFGFFAWAASFSPNPSRPFKVDYPFVVDDTTNKPLIEQTPSGPSFVAVPSILALWETFDPFAFLNAAPLNLIQRQAIYLDGGANTTTEIIDNVGARKFSDKLVSLNVKNQQLLFDGGHTTCTTINELTCYRFGTNMKFFSAKFSEGGLYTPDVLSPLVGIKTIEITDNAVMSISNKAIVGVQTDPQNGITTTNLTFSITGNGRLEIGNATNLGGGLQIGNTYGKANLLFDPSLATNSITTNFIINGPGATLQIGRQGFLGLSVGLDGNQTLLPNFWGVSSLANVTSVQFNLIQGTLLHNQIASSTDPKAALFALGTSIDKTTSFTFNFSPNTFIISGGANLAELTLANLVHPTVQNVAGAIPPGFIYPLQVFTQGLFDAFYGPPKGEISSQTIYTNLLNVSIFSSSLMLADTQKTPLPSRATADQLFAYLSVTDYLQQGTKRAAITILDDQLTVGYTVTDNQGNETIQRQPIAVSDPCNPLSKPFDAGKIIEEGAVGIKLVTINGKKVILRLYDLNPTIPF